MRCFIRLLAGSLLVTAVAAGTALADNGHEHEGDFIIGIGSGATPQLKFEFDEHMLSGEESIGLPPIDPPNPGVYEGWAADEPGFDHLHEPEPGEDFYPLGVGAEIYLVGIDLDAGLYVRAPAIGSPVAISPTPTLGSLRLGDEELHSHAIWHIDALAAGFDPLQETWAGTFKLVDLGTTGYADSEPFTLTFERVPEPASLLLVLAATYMSLMRRKGKEG